MEEREHVFLTTGERSPLRSVLDEVRHVAPSGAHVLVAGEPGTGTEELARAIHAWSRRSGAFVALRRLGGRDEVMARAFGAGGAAAGEPGGLVAAARGGTLFVEELADLPRVVQAALAVHLARERVSRSGDAARVVASTTADPGRAVAQGRLLRELHDAFAYGVTIPPLRGRPGDVAAILERLWDAWGERRVLEARALLVALAHPWPGNAAELNAFVSRLALLAEGDPITAAEAAKQLRVGGDGRRPSPRRPPVDPEFWPRIRAG
jgi:DNA-binding NtrC family response regulator